jgi:hypothetical protein
LAVLPFGVLTLAFLARSRHAALLTPNPDEKIMQNDQLPTAMAAATGLPETTVALVLRRLREAGCIPSGRSPTMTNRHVARVLLALTAPVASRAATHVSWLEALPNRYLPAEHGASAGDGLEALVSDLVSGERRTNGIISINTSWGAVTMRWLDANATVVEAEFGAGDHTVNRLLASTVTMPLVAVLAVAQTLLATE